MASKPSQTNTKPPYQSKPIKIVSKVCFACQGFGIRLDGIGGTYRCPSCGGTGMNR